MPSNKHNLPDAIVNLFGARQYSRGKSRWSVTQLISPPQIAVLREEYAAEISEKSDLSDSFWSLMGSNIHKILEHGSGANHVVEERVFLEVDGTVISGQIDVQKHAEGRVGIIDWKFTSVYAVSRPKEEWEQQANCYAYLLRVVKGYGIDSLQVCAILRDWSKSNIARRKNYPEAPIVMVDLPLWSQEKQESFIRDRLKALNDASARFHLDLPLPPCSPEDRWQRDGDAIRCKNYCDASEWCAQWKLDQIGLETGEKSDEEVSEAPPRRPRGRPRRTVGASKE